MTKISVQNKFFNTTASHFEQTIFIDMSLLFLFSSLPPMFSKGFSPLVVKTLYYIKKGYKWLMNKDTVLPFFQND